MLCGAGPGSGNWRRATRWGFPARGRLTLRESDDESSRRGFRGLPWGVGDPAAAFLDSPQWAVVRLDDEADVAEEFFGGTVLYRGDPRGAIETLIQHGADRAAMSVALRLPDENGIADVGAFGVAIAGDSGMARGGDHSHVLVPDGYGGLAVAGRGGRATVGGTNGIAIVGADGHANACGLAIAREAGSWVVAREAGVAAALASAHGLEVDDGGIAVGLGHVRRITVGPRAIAVVREASSSSLQVTLGEAALAIVRFLDSPGDWPRFAVAVAGPGGLEPGKPYIWENGAFHLRSEHQAPPSAADEAQDALPAPAAAPPPGYILCEDTDDIVIGEDGDWAIARGQGIALAGPGGLAQSGDTAQAGDSGIAITGGGTARAGRRGVAISDNKRYGTSEAGDGGLAVGLGSRFGMITAGDGGAAIYAGSFGIVTAGDEGVAIGGFESRVEVGANGVAIASCKCPSGGPGSLLVCRGPDGEARWAVVGPSGGIPQEFLQWAKQLDRPPIQE